MEPNGSCNRQGENKGGDWARQRGYARGSEGGRWGRRRGAWTPCPDLRRRRERPYRLLVPVAARWRRWRRAAAGRCATAPAGMMMGKSQAAGTRRCRAFTLPEKKILAEVLPHGQGPRPRCIAEWWMQWNCTLCLTEEIYSYHFTAVDNLLCALFSLQGRRVFVNVRKIAKSLSVSWATRTRTSCTIFCRLCMCEREWATELFLR
jgi:hypothetical protein